MSIISNTENCNIPATTQSGEVEGVINHPATPATPATNDEGIDQEQGVNGAASATNDPAVSEGQAVNGSNGVSTATQDPLEPTEVAVIESNPHPSPGAQSNANGAEAFMGSGAEDGGDPLAAAMASAAMFSELDSDRGCSVVALPGAAVNPEPEPPPPPLPATETFWRFRPQAGRSHYHKTVTLKAGEPVVSSPRASKLHTATEYRVPLNLDAIATALKEWGEDPRSALVAGVLLDPEKTTYIRRLATDKTEEGEVITATLGPVSRHTLILDIDSGLEQTDDLESVWSQVQGHLPDFLRGVRCVAAFTGSHGFKEGTRCRLVFILDRPALWCSRRASRLRLRGQTLQFTRLLVSSTPRRRAFIKT